MLCSRVARASRQTIRRNPHHHSEKEPRVVKHVPESESYHSESITKYYSVVPIPLLPHLTPLSQSNSSGFVTNQWSFPFVTFTYVCSFLPVYLSVCPYACHIRNKLQLKHHFLRLPTMNIHHRRTLPPFYGCIYIFVCSKQRKPIVTTILRCCYE